MVGAHKSSAFGVADKTRGAVRDKLRPLLINARVREGGSEGTQGRRGDRMERYWERLGLFFVFCRRLVFDGELMLACVVSVRASVWVLNVFCFCFCFFREPFPSFLPSSCCFSFPWEYTLLLLCSAVRFVLVFCFHRFLFFSSFSRPFFSSQNMLKGTDHRGAETAASLSGMINDATGEHGGGFMWNDDYASARLDRMAQVMITTHAPAPLCPFRLGLHLSSLD